MFDTIAGLPTHPLVVHATVVVVPVAALVVGLAGLGHSGAEAAWSDDRGTHHRDLRRQEWPWV